MNEEIRAAIILQQFISIFSSKGWLNRSIRIKHHDKKYRLMCSEKLFIAFRCNDNYGISPGIPGWNVCIIDQDQIIQDSDFSPFASDEPSAHDWLHSLQENDFEELPESCQS
jgi:hypothetical protein